jgi:3-methyladenine DNA glycosylase AlkD
MRSESSNTATPPRQQTVETIVQELKRLGSPKAKDSMSRFGIRTSSALGISIPQLRNLAKKIGTDHGLALKLWKTKIHEARILASMIDDPSQVTQAQMEEWAVGFDSWDLVDNCCGNLFDKTPFPVPKAHEWSMRTGEYVKRAGFALMAELAVHDKKASHQAFLEFLPVIVREASDDRNFVKKAVNWALRQIGKRNVVLNEAAIRTSMTIRDLDSRSAKWIAADALRELRSPAVKKKLAGQKQGRAKV